MEIADLIYKHFKGTLTPEEKLLLDDWLAADDRNKALMDSFENPELLADDIAFFDAIDVKSDWTIVAKRAGYKHNKRRIIAWSLSIAASVLLIVALTWKQPAKKEIVIAKAATKSVIIQPGSNKAVLQLASGQTVTLGDQADTITEQNGTSIRQRQGQLVYNGGDETKIQYNMLTTPRGGQYQLVLEDGTAVWLNASSSLKFPVKFIGKERVVELSGEGYFEVAKNKLPFLVKVNGMEVAVLGTHFNVMAYEGITKTTLTEGAVKIRLKDNRNWQLVPGQQATVNESNEVKIGVTDVDKALAWKNGIFYFKDDELADIMEQVGRWYDVDIKIKGSIPAKRISGNIRRQANLPQVLDMLNFVSNAKFNIEGRTVYVSF
jgi:ferric-dicitrate binding protein FerR (iron transport regulator)